MHFTPEMNWINDPNGLLFYKGYFQLFYQHNPYGNQWGHMSWGHAKSKDLVNWEHLPVALKEQPEFAIFSGSAVFDEENHRLVAIYTAHRSGNQSQHIAISIDDGITWQEHPGNPVLDIGYAEFRDPKVFRYHDRWIMAVVKAHEEICSFYQSKDLLNWEFLSEFVGEKSGLQWECPDLFELNGRWVLILSANVAGSTAGCEMRYYIGDFDGQRFSTRWQKPKIFDFGADCYAGVTFNGASDRIFIAWMNNWLYANKLDKEIWNGSMTAPRKLQIINEQIFQEFLTPTDNFEIPLGKSVLKYPEGNLLLQRDTNSLRINRSELWAEELLEFEIPMRELEGTVSAVFDSGSIELSVGGQSLTCRINVGPHKPSLINGQ